VSIVVDKPLFAVPYAAICEFATNATLTLSLKAQSGLMVVRSAAQNCVTPILEIGPLLSPDQIAEFPRQRT